MVSTAEHPILFSGPMVNSILVDQKTQTRRVVRPQPDPDWGFDAWMPGEEGNDWYCYVADYPDEGSQRWNCPYGKVGDVLWVRETWSDQGESVYPHQRVLYRADFPYHAEEMLRDELYENDVVLRWRPSIYMPRKESRIALEVENVTVERLQSIDELGALAEGCIGKIEEGVLNGVRGRHVVGAARDEFAALWDAVNAKRGFTWQSNPWVWVVTFRRVR